MCSSSHGRYLVLALIALLFPQEGQAQSVDLANNYTLGYRSFEAYTPEKIGSFSVGGALGSSVGYDDNINEAGQDKNASWFFRPSVYLWANSDWKKHAFNISAYGEKTHFTGGSADHQYYGNVFTYGRIDLSKEAQFELVSSYRFDEDNRGDASFGSNFTSTPANHQFDTKAFLSHGFGDAAVTLRAGVQVGLHENSRTNGGAVAIRDDQDYVLYDIRLRGSLNVGKTSNVFIEGGVNHWKFDQKIDRNGFERGSNGFHVAAGLLFQPSNSFSGEIAVGYKEQSFPDANFSKLSTFTLDAWATWALTDRANLTAVADTWLKEETDFNQSGTLSRSFSLQADYRIHDRFRVFAIGYYLLEDNLNQKSDRTAKGTIGFDYEVGHNLVFTTQFQHKQFMNKGPGSDYTINRLWIGFKITK